jgi:alginate O-acetyltransferase complex protein AlgI
MPIDLALRARGLSVLVFVLSFCYLVYIYNAVPALFTIALSVVVWLFYRLIAATELPRKALAYSVFFMTPFLTYTGQIAVLTGFGGEGASLPWVGVSFVTAALALHMYQKKLDFVTLCLNILQPARMDSGPVALGNAPPARLRVGRLKVYVSWMVLGIFFYTVLATGLAPFLVLRDSTEPVDILVFSIIFELYVYFNFSGLTFFVFGLLNLAGVRAALNFNMPFSARNVIDYWQRWHISLSGVLKEIFFKPVKRRCGLVVAVMVVFLSSAAWHGMSLNFFIWGLFHAAGWLLTYAIVRGVSSSRVAMAINVVLFPFFVVIGRLIFSEPNAALLGLKLKQLFFNFSLSPETWLFNLKVGGQSLLLLGIVIVCVMLEIFAKRSRQRYQWLRQKWVTPLLLLLSIFLGSTGLGGVYGAR